MRLRRVALLIAFYVSVDLTNPFIGGAFSFEVEDSVDGVSNQHERLCPQVGGLLPERSRLERADTARTAPVRAVQTQWVDEWIEQLRQARASLSDPQASSEDH